MEIGPSAKIITASHSLSKTALIGSLAGQCLKASPWEDSTKLFVILDLGRLREIYSINVSGKEK